MNNYCNFRYVLYKLPKVSQSSDPVIRKGLAYLYMTNKTVDKGWQLSKKRISEKNSIPGNTLTPLYNNVRKNTLYTYLLYLIYLTDCLFKFIY